MKQQFMLTYTSDDKTDARDYFRLYDTLNEAERARDELSVRYVSHYIYISVVISQR
jgi:hypothetical protein